MRTTSRCRSLVRGPRSGALLRLTVLRASLCTDWVGAGGTEPGTASAEAPTLTDTDLNFGPAWHGDELIFGSRRPGYPSYEVNTSTVHQWLKSMADERGIRQVVCLLGEEHLQMYEKDGLSDCVAKKTCKPTLIRLYEEWFGPEKVHWLPVADYSLLSADDLQKALAATQASVLAGERVVVHCSA